VKLARLTYFKENLALTAVVVKTLSVILTKNTTNQNSLPAHFPELIVNALKEISEGYASEAADSKKDAIFWILCVISATAYKHEKLQEALINAGALKVLNNVSTLSVKYNHLYSTALKKEVTNAITNLNVKKHVKDPKSVSEEKKPLTQIDSQASTTSFTDSKPDDLKKEEPKEETKAEEKQEEEEKKEESQKEEEKKEEEQKEEEKKDEESESSEEEEKN